MKRFAVLGLLACSSVFGGAVIQTGNTQLGVNDQGHLNYNGVGINYVPVGDGIAPGCACEGWGVSANGIVGWASVDNGGINNITAVNFTSTGSTATSVTQLTSLPGLTVTQQYGASAAADVFLNRVTIANTTGATMTDVRYTRAMDWDIPPTEFSELVTLNRGTAANLLFSNNNGFAVANPLENPEPYAGFDTNNVNFTDLGPADHGAFFTFGFGSLAAGQSLSFDIFYGAAGSETAALAALGAVGAEVYSFGQSSGNGATGTPATFLFAFKGVGGTVVVPPPPTGEIPEPGTYAMLGSGLAALIAVRMRRRA